MQNRTFGYIDRLSSLPGGMALWRIVLPLIFFIIILFYSTGHHLHLPGGTLLIFAAVVGGYMAINIGANDVANNVGPAVGSKAMTLTAAVILAAIFEAGGAFIAGGDVVGTIKKGIIDPSLIGDSATFIWLMLAALLAAALWLNLATYLGAPVSTTHSIVGGVLGAGIAAGGWQIADWDKLGQIVASWVISPILGGIIAALFLYLIKRTIIFRRDMVKAAKQRVPIFVALMAWAFGTYLVLKGLKKIGTLCFAGIAAGGWQIADWDKLGQIVASWVISPILGGIIAALFLYLIKRTIIFRRDMVKAAKQRVPIFVALMAWAFGTYLVLKGLKKIWKFDFFSATLIGLAIAIATYLIVKPMIAKAARDLDNSRDGINGLFAYPLIFAAALLSFAHGANDVANAIGPLAAINDAVTSGGISLKATIPFWVMAIGAVGISLGLLLFGPRLIKTVGTEITELDMMRACCIALAAAITVIIASQMGLPVSSTHIAVGGVFGVGFLREMVEANHDRKIDQIRELHGEDAPDVLEAFLNEYEASNFEEKGEMLKALKKDKEHFALSKKDRKSLKKVYRKELVKRSMVTKIAAAWVITVPVAATLAAMIYYMIRGMMLP